MDNFSGSNQNISPIQDHIEFRTKTEEWRIPNNNNNHSISNINSLLIKEQNPRHPIGIVNLLSNFLQSCCCCASIDNRSIVNFDNF